MNNNVRKMLCIMLSICFMLIQPLSASAVGLELDNTQTFEISTQVPPEAKEFANGGNFVVCSLENYGNSMALSYVERLKKLISNAQDYFDLSNYDEFKFLNDENQLKQYEKELVEREDKNVDILIEFYSDKLTNLKENQYIKKWIILIWKFRK